MMKLFHVTTRYFGDNIDWFVVNRAQHLFGAGGTLSVDYSDVITDYDDTHKLLRGSSEAALEEMFTKHEADTLVAWLNANRSDGNTEICERALPIENNIMPFGATPVGGDQDFLMLADAADYALPFKVWGYCKSNLHRPESPNAGANK
jgi:hypothetical protein